LDLNFSTEEAVKQGYLIIKLQGQMTTYIPTAKYKALFHPSKASIVMHSHLGKVSVEEVVYEWCGECGEIFPECWCPHVTTTEVPSPIKELSP